MDCGLDYSVLRCVKSFWFIGSFQVTSGLIFDDPIAVRIQKIYRGNILSVLHALERRLFADGR
jgi:hypothetical protein